MKNPNLPELCYVDDGFGGVSIVKNGEKGHFPVQQKPGGLPSPKANHFYVMSISITELIHQKQNLDGVIARTVEQMKARARLAEIVREQNEMELFRKVAETNPEAQRLIKILQGSLTHPNDPIKD